MPLRDRLLAMHGVLVRECGNKLGSSSAYLRLVVRPREDVARLVTGLGQLLYGSGRQSASANESNPYTVPHPLSSPGYWGG